MLSKWHTKDYGVGPWGWNFVEYCSLPGVNISHTVSYQIFKVLLIIIIISICLITIGTTVVQTLSFLCSSSIVPLSGLLTFLLGRCRGTFTVDRSTSINVSYLCLSLSSLNSYRTCSPLKKAVCNKILLKIPCTVIIIFFIQMKWNLSFNLCLT